MFYFFSFKLNNFVSNYRSLTEPIIQMNKYNILTLYFKKNQENQLCQQILSELGI